MSQPCMPSAGAPNTWPRPGAHFVEFYLVVHGLLKLVLVLVLLRGGGRWIFPVGAADPGQVSSAI